MVVCKLENVPTELANALKILRFREKKVCKFNFFF